MIFLTFISSNMAFAQVGAAAAVEGKSESLRVLSFSQWKEVQTVEAANRVARASNRVTAAKAKQLDGDAVAVLEKEHKKAVQALEITQQLTMEEYFHVYLSDFRDSQKALREAAKMMSAEEVAELIQVMLKTRHGVHAAALRSGVYPELTGPASKTP